MSASSEIPVVFNCEGARLIGIVHTVPVIQRRGVLIVVGGPQYRVGSHRQFLLLARFLAASGVPAMRFDCRGMGDSEGRNVDFERVGPDIRSAIDAFCRYSAGLTEVVLWGLCDAASAAMMYANSDSRVAGLALANPWVRSETSEGRAYLRHYYVQRVCDRRLWKQLLTGRIDYRKSIRSFARECRKAVGFMPSAQTELASKASSNRESTNFTARMRDGFHDFDGHTLFVLSGDDLTAAEFKHTVNGSRVWRKLVRRSSVTIHPLEAANHTFSKAAWRDEVANLTLDWFRTW